MKTKGVQVSWWPGQAGGAGVEKRTGRDKGGREAGGRRQHGKDARTFIFGTDVGMYSTTDSIQ